MTDKKRLVCCVLEWLKTYWVHLIAYGLASYYAFTSYFELGNQSNKSDLNDFLSPMLVLLAVAFVHLFTNPIPLPRTEACSDKERMCDEEVKKWQRRNWMIFAYSFMLLSLVLAIQPFMTPMKHIEHTEAAGQPASANSKDRFKTPIDIMIACSMTERDMELSCRDPIANATTPPDPSEGFWALNIGGYVKSCTADGNGMEICKVSGGLLVPLYFIILALMGGSISLTRRLPEYQKQAGPEYVPTPGGAAKLSQHEFREYLAFQMVQFLSAPLVAILAYYLVGPNNTVGSVAIAFMAGFSSETILLMVRSVTEKITPKSEQRKYGTVTGIVIYGDGPDKDKPIQGARVCLCSQPNLASLTDASGHYVLASVPFGEHGIKAIWEDNAVQWEGKAMVDVPDQSVVTSHLVAKSC